jgi:hypothetical protein
MDFGVAVIDGWERYVRQSSALPSQRRSPVTTERVDHLVVGGVAAQAYGATRTTSDLDCVPIPPGEQSIRDPSSPHGGTRPEQLNSLLIRHSSDEPPRAACTSRS